MPPAVRLGDKSQSPADAHGCPACPHPVLGPAAQGSPTVNINQRPAVRAGDFGVHAACCGPNTWSALAGSRTVFVNGVPLTRLGDMVMHCGGMGAFIEGSGNVNAGG
ncbi:MAG: PAAR domain-containing protein [Polyangiaceae bacterium]